MKHMKQKLVAATVMMILAAVMLSSVSYAWFTLSTNPEITDMTVNVSANQNLEIALDNNYANEGAVDTASEYASGVQGSTTGNPYTWGNLLDLTEAFSNFTPQIQPIKFTSDNAGGATLNYPKYGTDGRVSSLGELAGTVISDSESVNAVGGVKGWSVIASTAPYYAFSVDFWVRTNVSGGLKLQTEAAERADDGESTTSTVNSTQGAGSFISLPTDVYSGYSAEQKAAVEAYFAKLVISFVPATGAPVEATLTSGNNGTWALSTTSNIVTLAANTAQKISMYVYLDGEAITNEQALLADINGVVFNIQFMNTAIAAGGAMTGDDAKFA